MIARLLAGPILAAAAIAVAPLQCAHESDAAHCWDDAPGDGLWDLSQKFRDDHDDAAARRTLEYLIERYPASRFAPAARDWLGGARGVVASETSSAPAASSATGAASAPRE